MQKAGLEADIARLEHALDGPEDERERHRQRLDDARRRLASYRSRMGGEFAFAQQLADKRGRLAEVEKSLSQEVDIPLPSPKAA
jgi:predicted  nucleic acid-binding Zn-ribbon protein